MAETSAPPGRFVGRERELARVAAALEAAATGRRQRIIVSGPTGIGVSRLVEEVADRVGRIEPPLTVVRCIATEGQSREPYAPLVTGLGPILERLDDADLAHVVGPADDVLRALLPALGSRLGRLDRAGRPHFSVPPELLATRVAEGILGVFERLGERSPVLLTLEDIHLADQATRALAVFLVRISRQSRLCLLITYHTDQLTRSHPLHADLEAMADASEPPQRIELGPLNRDELAVLLERIDGRKPTAATLLLVSERSHGNPLIAEEVMAARRDLAGVAPGASLEALVAARLAVRSPECRRLLRLLAPVGEPVDDRTIAAIGRAYERLAEGLPPRSSSRPSAPAGELDADLAAGLAEARDAGFVVEAPGGRWAIRHALVARAIVLDLLPGQRRSHRAAVAAALDEVRPAAAAGHWLAAHQPERARDAALRAADAMEARGAAVDALALVELAMELGAVEERTRSGRTETRRRLVRAGALALRSGAPVRAIAFLEVARRGFDERTDGAALVELHDLLSRARRVLGDQAGAIAELERAAHLARSAPAEAQAGAAANLAQALMLDGRFSDAEREARRALDLAGEVPAGGGWVRGHALCTLGISAAWGPDPASALALLEEARTIAEASGRADDWFRATANLSTALALLGRRDASIATARAGIDALRRDGLETAYGNALRGNIAEALFLTGRWSEARDLLSTALEWSPSPEAFADAAVTLAALEIEAEADERAASLLGRLLLTFREGWPDPQFEIPASRAAASFALWRNDVADAGRAAETGWELARRGEDWLQASRMASTYLEVQAATAISASERRDLAELAGARERAAGAVAAAEALVRASGVPADSVTRREADAHLATARAYAARLAGRDEPAAWESAARAWDRLGDPYQGARARWRQAEAAMTAHDDARVGRRAARRPLRDAATIAAELGARPLLREIRELAGRALIALPEGLAGEPTGGSMPTTGAAPAEVGVAVMAGGSVGAIASAFAEQPSERQGWTFGLSPREREVLSLIVQGRTNREIGERLFISQKTVGVHVGNILSKLGASGRVEAAMVAVRLELVPRP
jgi:DNA-binding CsgD family transcriptional regulator/tetratricopeptide (TPR) repeat protein